MYTSGSSAARASPGVKATGLVNATGGRATPSASEDSAGCPRGWTSRQPGTRRPCRELADSSEVHDRHLELSRDGILRLEGEGSRLSSLSARLPTFGTRSSTGSVTTAVARSTSRTTTVVADLIVCSNAIRGAVSVRAEGLSRPAREPRALTSNGAPSRKGRCRGSLLRRASSDRTSGARSPSAVTRGPSLTKATSVPSGGDVALARRLGGRSAPLALHAHAHRPAGAPVVDEDVSDVVSVSDWFPAA